MARIATESAASWRCSLDTHAERQRSAPDCRPTSGATIVRRSAPAMGSRSLGDNATAMRDKTTQPANRPASTRLPRRAAVATLTSRAENRRVLFVVVENASRAANDTRERILVDVDGQASFLAEQQIEAANQRAAAGHDDAAVDDVGRQLRRSDFQRATHSVDDLLNGFLNRFANLTRVHTHSLRNSGDEIAALHFHLALVADRRSRTDGDLDLLGRRLTDEQIVILAHELHDGGIQLVAAGAN